MDKIATGRTFQNFSWTRKPKCSDNWLKRSCFLNCQRTLNLNWAAVINRIAPQQTCCQGFFTCTTSLTLFKCFSKYLIALEECIGGFAIQTVSLCQPRGQILMDQFFEPPNESQSFWFFLLFRHTVALFLPPWCRNGAIVGSHLRWWVIAWKTQIKMSTDDAFL